MHKKKGLRLVKGRTRHRVPSADAIAHEVTRARVARIEQLRALVHACRTRSPVDTSPPLPHYINRPVPMRMSAEDVDTCVRYGFDIPVVSWPTFQRRVRKYLASLARSSSS